MPKGYPTPPEIKIGEKFGKAYGKLRFEKRESKAKDRAKDAKDSKKAPMCKECGKTRGCG